MQTGATRFPETNLDLYSPRRLSTVDVDDIVSEHSYRSIATDSEPETSSSQLEIIVEDTSVIDDDEGEIYEAPTSAEDDEMSATIQELKLKEDNEDENSELVTCESDDDESWTSFFKAKEEDKLKLEVCRYLTINSTYEAFSSRDRGKRLTNLDQKPITNHKETRKINLF